MEIFLILNDLMSSIGINEGGRVNPDCGGSSEKGEEEDEMALPSISALVRSNPFLF